MTLELYSNTTAQHLLVIEGFIDLLNELRDSKRLIVTETTAIELNNYLNHTAELIDGSIRLNEDVIIYLGHEQTETEPTAYDYIIKQNDAEKGIVTFSIHNRGSFMYERLIARAF